MYFVHDSAPAEDKAICDLMNRGFSPRRLFNAAYSFYREDIEESLRNSQDLKVRSGLFQGMHLSPEVLASQLLPKVIGTYEKEVQDYLLEFENSFDRFVNIGCAEGFYVAGIARWKSIPCLGVDINPLSRNAVSYSAASNNVSHLISFSTEINDVENFVEGDVFCLVDVDGAEMQVLQDLHRFYGLARSLSSVRLVVESDRSSDGNCNISDIVNFLSFRGWSIDRIIRQNPSNRFLAKTSNMSFMDQAVSGAEGRPGRQSWIVAVKNFC